MPPRNRKRELLDATAAYYNLPPSALLTPSKRPEIVIARWHYWTRLVCEAGYSLPMAGRATGGHDHASVLYGIRKYFSREIGIKVHTLDDARRAYYSGGYGDYAEFWCANLRRIGLVVYPAPAMPVLEAACPALEAA